MDDLQQFYRNAVGDRVAALERAPLRLDSGATSAEETVRQLAHTLKGSGSSYGFPEVSCAAGVAERAPAGQLWSKGRDLVDILKAITAGVEYNTIVVVEDDTLTAALIIHRLEHAGYEVEHHADGTSALAAVDAHHFGLDVQMPGANGFDVLKRERSNPELNRTSVLMLTAVGSERDVVRGFELEADDYILKPFSPAELTARLQRFTRSHP